MHLGGTKICLFLVSKYRPKREVLLKGDKEKKGKGSWMWPFCHVLFQCRSQSIHPKPSCDSPRISLPSVWLGWPWSPKSRSSPLKIRLLIPPLVECSCTDFFFFSHIILLVTTYLLFQTWIKMHNSVTECCGPVFDTLLSSGLSMTECACIYILASVSALVTKTRYDEANHSDKVNIHQDPATKCPIMLS